MSQHDLAEPRTVFIKPRPRDQLGVVIAIAGLVIAVAYIEHQPTLIENDRFDDSAAFVTSFGGVRYLITVGIIRGVLYRARCAVLFVNMAGEQILVLVRNLLDQRPAWSEAVLPAKSFRRRPMLRILG